MPLILSMTHQRNGLVGEPLSRYTFTNSRAAAPAANAPTDHAERGRHQHRTMAAVGSPPTAEDRIVGRDSSLER